MCAHANGFEVNVVVQQFCIYKQNQQDPSIREMAEQIASDTMFNQMALMQDPAMSSMLENFTSLAHKVQLERMARNPMDLREARLPHPAFCFTHPSSTPPPSLSSHASSTRALARFRLHSPVSSPHGPRSRRRSGSPSRSTCLLQWTPSPIADSGHAPPRVEGPLSSQRRYYYEAIISSHIGNLRFSIFFNIYASVFLISIQYPTHLIPFFNMQVKYGEATKINHAMEDMYIVARCRQHRGLSRFC